VSDARSEADVQAALDRAESWLRSELAGLMRIKRMPVLRLRYVPLPLFRAEGGGQ
jgi:ribosome-binding factor A